MPRWLLLRAQWLCLMLSAKAVLSINIINYYFIDDRKLQWELAIKGISGIMFLLAVYAWIGESIKKNIITSIVSGWVALYLLINLGVVLLGFNLYTKGVIEMFTITTMGAISHIGIRLWQKHY